MPLNTCTPLTCNTKCHKSQAPNDRKANPSICMLTFCSCPTKSLAVCRIATLHKLAKAIQSFTVGR